MKSLSIRRRIINSFVHFALLLFAVVSVFLAVTVLVLAGIGNYYKNNAKLDYFIDMLASTQKSMERYIKMRSYEAIDAYYKNRSQIELASMEFCMEPNADEILQKEYTVFMLTESFTDCADSTVYSCRAANSLETQRRYAETCRAYAILQSEVRALNMLYFKKSIARYNYSLNMMKTAGVLGLAALGAAVALNVILVGMRVSKIILPLADISEASHRIAERDFDIPLFTYDKDDEIGSICSAFNRMIISIKEYVDTIWEKAIAENELREKEVQMYSLYREAQLKALQARINPHFLFNTMNTGAQLAMMEGADRTCSFLEQVSDFFRYNLQHTKGETTLGEELRLVDNYIYIMKVRFGTKFTFEKDIRYSNQSFKIPCMILQPLVEDCIKHGLYEVSKGGKILLKVYTDFSDGSTCLFITVSDNGCGFNPEVRKRLMDNLSAAAEENLPAPDDIFTGTYSDNNNAIDDESGSGEKTQGQGIGLQNVISRLRIYYRSRDVFSIEDNKDGGTVFIIKVRNV